MTEYIEHEAALKEFEKVCNVCMALVNKPMCGDCSVADTVRKVKSIPAADVRPRWIPVTERLPEHEYGESTSVLTVDLYGVMRVTYFDGGNWCWPTGEALTTMRVAPITHWMPLPKGPKED